MHTVRFVSLNRMKEMPSFENLARNACSMFSGLFPESPQIRDNDCSYRISIDSSQFGTHRVFEIFPLYSVCGK